MFSLFCNMASSLCACERSWTAFWRPIVASILVVGAVVALPIAIRAEDLPGSIGLRPAQFDPKVPATRSYFIYTVAPGAPIDDRVVIINTGGATTVRLYTVDAITSENSGAVYPGRGATPEMVGHWLRLDRDEIDLGANERRELPFRIQAPTDLPPGQYLGGIVAEDVRPRRTEAGALQLNLVSRMVVAVLINVPGEHRSQLNVTGASVADLNGQSQLRLDIGNHGNMLTKATGETVVTDAVGRERARLPIDLDTIVPNTRISFPLPLASRLEPGDYTVQTRLAYENGESRTFETALNLTAPIVPPNRPNTAAPIAISPPRPESKATAADVDTSAQSAAASTPTAAASTEGVYMLLGFGAFGVLAIGNLAVWLWIARRRLGRR